MPWSKATVAGLLLAAFTATSAAAPELKASLFHKDKYIMGTVFEIVVYHPSSDHAAQAMEEALQEIVRLDGVMSNYKTDSELSRLNRTAHFRAQVVSSDLYRVIVEEAGADGGPVAEATVRVRVKGMLEHTAAAGNGPVNALDHALRKALEEFYPNLKEMRLLDYKVRILDESKGTAAKTRVLITSGDSRETWGTVGVADNIIEASWRALVDSVEFKLRADERRGATS